MIRCCEGTDGPNGYRTLFGGKLFTDMSKHPNVRVPFGSTYSTAAGAYQFLFATWETLRLRLSLHDFGPESQDRACLQLIIDAGALPDLDAGRLVLATAKCCRIWASLPGAPYGQPTRSFDYCQAKFTEAGGRLA